MTEKTYNGWKNYPTWTVNLWLSNDEPLYREALERTIDAKEQGGEMRSDRGSVADMFKEWVCDDLAPDLGSTLAADLLGHALDSVDWYEIADAWIQTVNDQDFGESRT